MLLGNQNNVSTFQIAEGAQGTKQTLDLMRQIVINFRKNDQIRRLASNLVRELQPKDYVGEVKAIHEYVKNSIRYLQDVYDVETLHTPDEIILRQQGDCDDKTILAASLLQSIGHPVRLVAVGFDNSGEYQHVYPETKIGNRWFTVETTEDVDIGWEPPGIRIKKVVYI